jgi:uncharacterized protein (TIGR00288 family)
MVNEFPQLATTNRNLALLIDADNISHTAIAGIIAELSKYGTANIRRSYGDWTAGNMKGWREKIHEFAIRPIQQFSYTRGKNATDMALVIDALELLYTQKLDAFCIASSDADFTPLVMHLRANGHDVFGFGERKTPEAFVNACTSFLYLEVPVSAADEPTATSMEAAAPAETKATVAPPSKKPAAKPIAKPLSQNTKLVTILRGAVEACAKDNGWALLSAVGSTAKRQAPIDPRNYAVKNFPALFEAVGLFEIQRGKNGQAYVADRKNKDRTKTPDE